MPRGNSTKPPERKKHRNEVHTLRQRPDTCREPLEARLRYVNAALSAFEVSCPTCGKGNCTACSPDSDASDDDDESTCSSVESDETPDSNDDSDDDESTCSSVESDEKIMRRARLKHDRSRFAADYANRNHNDKFGIASDESSSIEDSTEDEDCISVTDNYCYRAVASSDDDDVSFTAEDARDHFCAVCYKRFPHIVKSGFPRQCRTCGEWFHAKCRIFDEEDPEYWYCCRDHYEYQEEHEAMQYALLPHDRIHREVPYPDDEVSHPSYIGQRSPCSRCKRALLFPFEATRNQRPCCGTIPRQLLIPNAEPSFHFGPLFGEAAREMLYDYGQEMNQCIALTAVTLDAIDPLTGEKKEPKGVIHPSGGAAHAQGEFVHFNLAEPGTRGHPWAGNLSSFFYLDSNNTLGEPTRRFKEMPPAVQCWLLHMRDKMRRHNEVIRSIRALFKVHDDEIMDEKLGERFEHFKLQFREDSNAYTPTGQKALALVFGIKGNPFLRPSVEGYTRTEQFQQPLVVQPRSFLWETTTYPLLDPHGVTGCI